MSNHDHLRLVTLPPALASATMCGLLPSPPSSELFVPLPNKRCRQALHMCRGASQLQSTFANGFHDPNSPHFSLKSLEFCVDTGQVIIHFAVVCDICSDAPVIKSVGCFGEVSMNGWGTGKELMEPSGKGVNGFR